MAELAWEAARVAILTVAQEECRAGLERAGWLVVKVDHPVDEILKLLRSRNAEPSVQKKPIP